MTITQDHFSDANLSVVVNGIQQQTRLKGVVTSATEIEVGYDTINGNLPNTYGNALWAWQDTIIPFGTDVKPAGQMPVDGNTQQGTMFLEKLELSSKPYIVGYSTGKDRNTIVSTLQFMPGNPVGVPFASSLFVQSATGDAVLAYFETPDGNDPARYGNWIGVWEGKVARLDGVGVKSFVPISKTNANGTQVVRGPFKFDTWYTLALGTAMKDEKPVYTTIGTTYTFKTAPFTR